MSNFFRFQHQDWEDVCLDSGLDMYMDSGEVEITNSRMEESPFLPFTSLELLKQKSSRIKRLREGNQNKQSSDTQINGSSGSHQAMSSTASIIKLAKEKLLELNSQNADVLSRMASYIASDVSEDFVLAILLQAAAEKVVNQEYIYARKLLRMCGPFSSKIGNSPIQRLVFYVVEALQEKIDRGCGTILPAEEEKNKSMDEKLAMINLRPEILASQQENPFSLVCQFMGVGTIRDRVASAEKVHLIDFSIDNGSHWTLIMQDFAAAQAQNNDRLKLLKITAVGTCRKMMEETGKSLSNFAETINLPFSFNIIVSDLKDLKEEVFELEADEAVAVYLGTRLWTLLAWPNYLELFIRKIKSLKPCVMVVKEIEASTNTQNFLERFYEALILLSGIFDGAKDCMENHILYRKFTEEFCCRNMIQNIITAEGAERVHRYERIPFWRSLFAKFGIVETNLSRSSFRRAKLLLKSSARFSSFTIDYDGKCLILGWKRTPFLSVAAWKFQND